MKHDDHELKEIAFSVSSFDICIKFVTTESRTPKLETESPLIFKTVIALRTFLLKALLANFRIRLPIYYVTEKDTNALVLLCT